MGFYSGPLVALLKLLTLLLLWAVAEELLLLLWAVAEELLLLLWAVAEELLLLSQL
jgi:hypothetical protein